MATQSMPMVSCLSMQQGDLQLGAHAVGAGDQHGMLDTGTIQLKQAAEAAQPADGSSRRHRAGHMLFHQLDRGDSPAVMSTPAAA